MDIRAELSLNDARDIIVYARVSHDKIIDDFLFFTHNPHEFIAMFLTKIEFFAS